MQQERMQLKQAGFCSQYYPHPQGSRTTVLVTLGQSTDNWMIQTSVRWLHRFGCNAMAIAPRPEDKGFRNFPLESFGQAIAWLKDNGSSRFGVMGGSITGMLALLAASCCPEITFTLAVTPCDFVAEGFCRDGLDGARERPGDGEASVSWQGKSLPCLPYAYRHPRYWQKIREESQAGGNAIASRQMFDRSEFLHPLTEAEKIKVERIHGTLIVAGAEDDCLWDTCRYIRRISDRLEEKQASCRSICLLYRHGTHFLFPQSWMELALPGGLSLLPGLLFRAGREKPLACRRSRMDLDALVTRELEAWMQGL